jgi:hypothetical protein
VRLTDVGGLGEVFVLERVSVRGRSNLLMVGFEMSAARITWRGGVLKEFAW